MTRDQWARLTEPAEMIAEASYTIPKRYLCLVLVELAQPAVERWAKTRPDDWRLALGLAVMRAWCFFLATDGELAHAEWVVSSMREGAGSSASRDDAAIASVERCLRIASLPESGERATTPDGLAEAAFWCVRAVQYAQGLEGPAGRALVPLVRQRIVYTPDVERDWLPNPGIVFAGAAVLRIDGREIGDVVPRWEFETLSAERSVAFDRAQQDAEPESEAQVAYRHRVEKAVADRARQRAEEARVIARGGCLMRERPDGSRIIMCFGPPSPPPTPPPPPRPPIDIVRDDPIGLEIVRKTTARLPGQTDDQFELHARERAAQLYETRNRRPRTEAALERLAEQRRRRAAVESDTAWAPGWLVFASVLFCLFIRPLIAIALFSETTGPTMTSGVTLLFVTSVSIIMFVGEREGERITAGVGAAAISWGLSYALFAAAESTVTRLLDERDLQTPSARTKLEERIARYEKRVAEDRARASINPLSPEEREEVAWRADALADMRSDVVRLRSTSQTTERLLAALTCAPLFLLIALVLAYQASHTLAWHLLRDITRDRTPLWVHGAWPVPHTRRPNLTDARR